MIAMSLLELENRVPGGGKSTGKMSQAQEQGMGVLQRGEAAIHYEVVGSGAPLLLIAGTASDGASWAPLFGALFGRQMILIDNRGAGQTRFDGPIAMADMVADCSALVAHLALERVDVVGHSLGGMIALRLAAEHPEQVRRLVTLTSAGSAKSGALLADMARIYPLVPAETWFRLLFQWLFSPGFFTREETIAQAAAASAGYAHRQSPADFARQVAMFSTIGPVDKAAIVCPVLAVAGENDILATPADVAASHLGIADLTLMTLPDAAHSIHWEQPKAVAAVIAEFLL